jgi:zinc protease
VTGWRRTLLMTGAAFAASVLAGAARSAPLPQEIPLRPLRFEVPRPQRATLQNGVPVHLVEDRTLPTLSLTVLLRAGSADDPAGLAGTAEVTAEALRSGGAGDRTPRAFEDALADLGARIETEVDADFMEISLWTPATGGREAAALLADLLRRPAFDAGAVRTARERRLEEARREEDSPETLVEREFTRRLMAGHPYGNWPNEQSVARIRRAEVREFWTRHCRPSRLILAAAGDFQSAEMVEQLRSLFGTWEEPAPAGEAPEGGAAGRAPTAAGLPRPPRDPILISRDLAQTNMMIGHPGPSWDDPDLPALEVLEHVLTYYRYFLDVRDNRGLAYITFASFIPRRGPGIFLGYAGTRAEAAPEALGLMRKHLAEVAAGRFSDREVEGAREAVAASFLHRFSTAAETAQQFARAEMRGLPDAWLSGYARRVSALTPAELRRVAARHLHPEHLWVVVIGKDDAFRAVAAP